MAHSKGPWDTDGDEIFVASNDMSIALISHVESADIESAANARLIAAAPDLLSALKEMLALSGDPNAATGEFDTTAGRAFRVVAKAEGDR